METIGSLANDRNFWRNPPSVAENLVVLFILFILIFSIFNFFSFICSAKCKINNGTEKLIFMLCRLYVIRTKGNGGEKNELPQPPQASRM